jgi:hypothetical protein
MIGYAQMAEYDGGTGDFTGAPDNRTTGNTDTGSDSGMRADAHIVSDLDLVIEFAALLDHGIVEGPAIDRGIGAYLDVICDGNTAKLRDSVPLACMQRQPKTIGTDHHPGMQDTAISDSD